MSESIKDIFINFPMTDFAKLVDLPRQTINANAEILFDMLEIIITG